MFVCNDYYKIWIYTVTVHFLRYPFIKYVTEVSLYSKIIFKSMQLTLKIFF